MAPVSAGAEEVETRGIRHSAHLSDECAVIYLQITAPVTAVTPATVLVQLRPTGMWPDSDGWAGYAKAGQQKIASKEASKHGTKNK